MDAGAKGTKVQPVVVSYVKPGFGLGFITVTGAPIDSTELCGVAIANYKCKAYMVYL